MGDLARNASAGTTPRGPASSSSAEGGRRTRTPRPDARRRILDAASGLLYRHGIHGVGVDAIVQEADVAKATFYSHFRSKDELIVAWLRQPDVRWLNRAREESDRRATDPRERLLAFFDVLGELFGRRDFRGCPYLNTAAEIPDPRHPARMEVLGFQRELEAYLRQLAQAAGVRDAERLASELLVVVVGAWAVAVVQGSADAAGFGRATAEALLAGAADRERAPRAARPRSRR